MKQFIISVVSLIVAMPLTASAASFVVSPASGSYQTGDNVTLRVSVNPAGSTVYTAMLDARFSPAYFEVVSFNLDDAVLPLKAPGYDALDNTSGVLTKTGGYTGGITATAPFATVVLKAKASGTATFTIVDSSKLLDGSNGDQQNGSQSNSYIVTAHQDAAPTQTTLPVATTPEPSEKTPVAMKSDAKSPVRSEATSTVSTSTSQTAAAAGTKEGVIWWIAWICSLVIAFAAGYLIGQRSAAHS